MILRNFCILFLTGIIFVSCGKSAGTKKISELDSKMNNIAENYVRLVLRAGQLDNNFVDAYYGPDNLRPHDELKTPDDSAKVLNLCDAETDSLLDKLDALKNFSADKIETLRYKYLYKQLLSVKAKIFMLKGGSFSFDEESKALYDATAPEYSKEHFQPILDKLNKILPGNGSLSNRLEEFRKHFIIPKDKLAAVFNAAITECKKRTLNYISLPANENFKIEYVTNKPWSGYNWYKGNYFSVIQVTTDVPVYIDRAIDLAAHEGYPGHHVYNSLIEENLVKKNGWIEFSVYPLFSPQSLIAEGTANFGIEMVFPGKEKIDFEKKVLYPLSGLDPSKAEEYDEVLSLTKELEFAGNEAARGYLDGKWTAKQTIDWLENVDLMSPERAEQRLSFIEKYRSYVINYNVGEEIVKKYIEKNGGTEDHEGKRWELFKYLLTTPQVPSSLTE
jgi:hypothetical protein